MVWHGAKKRPGVLHLRLSVTALIASMVILLAGCGATIQPEGFLLPPSFNPDPIAEANVVVQAGADMVVDVAGAMLRASQVVERVNSRIEYYYRAPVGRHAMSVTMSEGKVYERYVEAGETGVNLYAIAADGSVHQVTVDPGAPLSTQPNE